MGSGLRLVDNRKLIVGFPAAVPSTSTSSFISLKNYNASSILIAVNNATTVTGSAISLTQATNVSGANAKALAFTKVFANLDTGASDLLVETVVSGNTFTTLLTNSKSALYVIEVSPSSLDIQNNFTSIRVALATGAACTISVIYALGGRSPRYFGSVTDLPTALID